MTTATRGTLTDAITDLLDAMLRGVDAASLDALVDRDLTLSQVRVVLHLADAPHACALSEIADGLSGTLPTACRAVDRLVQLGLASRREDPADRRSKLVQLTDAGRGLLAARRAAATDCIRAFVHALPPDVARDLHDAIRRALPEHAARVDTPA